MGRPKKKGLDYFPLDVDIFEDFGIKILMARYGSDGFTLYMYILTRAYREHGYYLIENEDLEYIVSSDLKMSREKVRQVLEYLFSRSLLVRKTSTLAVPVTAITSAGIQRRYQEAVKGRALKNAVEVKEEFWLLEAEETAPFIKVLPFLSNSEKNESFSRKNSDKSGKKCRKKSKEKNYIEIYKPPAVTYLSDPEVNKAFMAYLAMRSEAEDISEIQVNGLISKLLEISQEPAEQLKVIREATIHKWKSFFPLKKEKKAAPSGSGRQQPRGSFYTFEQRQYDRESLEAALLNADRLPDGDAITKEGAG